MRRLMYNQKCAFKQMKTLKDYNPRKQCVMPKVGCSFQGPVKGKIQSKKNKKLDEKILTWWTGLT